MNSIALPAEAAAVPGAPARRDSHCAYFATGMGLAFAIGGGAAVLAFAFGMLVSRPAASRAAALAGAMAIGRYVR